MDWYLFVGFIGRFVGLVYLLTCLQTLV